MILAIIKKLLPGRSDEELLASYKDSHDIQALSVLYKRYMHLVFGLCMKYLKNQMDSEDAVMDIFEKISDKLKHHDVKNFRTWIFYVSRNHCINKLKPNLEILLENEMITKDFMENHEDDGHYDNELLHLGEALNALKTNQQLCLEMFYLQSMNYQEIEKETGLSYKEVKSNIQNGKRNLKIILERLEHE